MKTKKINAEKILSAQELETFKIDKDLILYEYQNEENEGCIPASSEGDEWKYSEWGGYANYIKFDFMLNVLEITSKQNFGPFVNILFEPKDSNVTLSICISLKGIYLIIRLIKNGDFFQLQNWSNLLEIPSTQCLINLAGEIQSDINN